MYKTALTVLFRFNKCKDHYEKSWNKREGDKK